MRTDHRLTLRLGVALAALLLPICATAGSAGVDSRSEHHCVNHDGVDLNQLHQMPHQIVTGFCTEVSVGELWVPAAAWITNHTHEVIPPGYVPSRPTPIEDFNAKFVRAEYVVDAGTERQRSYRFSRREVLRTGLIYPPLGLPMSAFVPVLQPLRAGSHTVDIFVVLAADHWDGFDIDPAADMIPAGKTHWDHVEFDVVEPSYD